MISGRTRRSTLRLASVTAATAVVPATSVAAESEWTVAETPVDTSLHDVTYATNAFAVGGGGTVIERRDGGWQTVLQGGPTGGGNDLNGTDATDDGKRLWVVGASGAIGEYDVTTGNLIDRSAPNDSTSNFNDVAVTCSAGSAEVYVADDSGAIHYSFKNGEKGTWEYATPGSGAGLEAIDFYSNRSGHAIDTNDEVFATDDGVTYDTIGIDDADVTFYGLDSDAVNDVAVSGGNGSVFDYDGSQWTPTNIGAADLFAIETAGDDGYAVGSDGAIFELSGGEWSQMTTPVSGKLNAVARGSTDIVVGAGGTVLER